MYRAPIEDIEIALNQVAGLTEAIKAGQLGDLSEDLVTAILEEAGKFAADEIAPLNKIGDAHGTPLKNGVVTTPPGWKETYHKWIEGGWNSLTGPEEFGGQGLPTMLAMATSEMWNSASMAFGLGPLLTVGAIESIHKHGSDDLKSKYLEKLVSGEWMGTMNLTEPQAGTDLASLKAKAERADDGTYRIFGQKIFITYGEHDMTENICHLVLARLPDAPKGTRGISLFLVPKFIVNDEGQMGQRNDVFCQSVEHKLGIHGSPTCVMIYGDGYQDNEPGAIGYLIGEENNGLACMFTMMNNARLSVGIQGVAIGEAAFQHALAYAHERRQGRADAVPGIENAPIVHHPDVARNLLTMKSMVQAARGICYSCAHSIDMARHARITGNEDEHKKWSERASLITPIAKSFSTDMGVEVASIGVQVHGGMGYIEETGAAQLLRDARINTIYEGTNGIQAIDLIMRKLTLSGGQTATNYLAEFDEVITQVKQTNEPGFGECAARLETALEDVRQTIKWLLDKLENGERGAVLAGATPFQRMMGLTAGGMGLAKAGLSANAGNQREISRFFAENFLAETGALKTMVMDGGESLDAAKKLLAV